MLPRFAVTGVTEVEMTRDSRRGKLLCLAVKFRLRTLQMDKEKLVRLCYEWQAKV
jgi:hypothetical protein